MERHILNLKKKFTNELGRTSSEYLQNGLVLFHRYLEADFNSKEAVVNNLTTAIEMYLKCYIADKNLGLIFRNIPMDVKVLFTCPESIPEFFEWRKYNFSFLSTENNTITLKEAITCLYTFFPHMKQMLMPHLDYFNRWANSSAHSILPAFNRFDIERFGFTALRVYTTLCNDESFPYPWYDLTGSDREFLKLFEKNRIERALGAMDNARNKLKDIKSPRTITCDNSSWEKYITKCPVCHSDGILDGYTEVALTEDEEGKSRTLDFFAVSFRCDVCGLVLNDIEELKTAGMNTLFDRTKELEDWFRENEDFSNWYME
jgi:hypothetical protein